MSNNILFFNEIKENDFNLVGGKAYNLGKMIQEKFPIPNGFSITTIAFKEFISFLYEEEIFEKLINTNIEEINKIEEVCAKLRNLIISKPISKILKDDIEKALNTIGKENFYSIRSSATAEDLPSMSFAGQQDTYLNIHGIDELIYHIKKCFASLYTQRAVIYRKKNNLIEKEVSMSVIVQKMVNSNKSGIMFTVNPITNNYNELTIDAGFGLGETLVSGLISPDFYKYDKHKNKIIETKINKKEIAIYRKKQGGTDKRILDENIQYKQVLTLSEIKEVASIGKGIEEYYKYPQDIEWAIDDENKLYILQSRAITSLYPKIDKNHEEDKVYISLNHIQVMTDPVKPLGIDMFKRIFPYKQDKNTGKSLAITSGGGRVYIDLTEILKLPFRNKIIKLISSNVDYLMGNALENYLMKNKLNKKIPSINMIKGAKNSIFYIFKKGIKNIKSKTKPNAEYEINLFIEEFINNIKSEIESTEDLESKINVIKKLAPRTLITIFKNIGPYIMAGILSYKSLIRLLKKNNIDTNLVNKIVSGLEGNVTTEMGLRVGDLTDCIRGKEDIIKILKEHPKNAHMLILEKNYDELNICLNKFLDDYGMRGLGEIDISNPRYKDDFTMISKSIINNLNMLKEKEHRENYNKLIQESRKTEEMILKLIKEKNSKDLKKAKNYIDNIRCFLSMREHGKYAIIKAFDVYRKAIYECADKLKLNNVIENKDDIIYLTLDEIILGLNGKTNFKEEFKKIKEKYKSYYKLTPPRVIDNNGEIYLGSYKKSQNSNVLVATSVSSGIYEGYAKVILDPSSGSLEKGEILVTKFTDPGWTPFFINAKGLILEVGGLMTHGAIVAREYGIPALVGLDNATDLIKTGDYLRIDANNGYIEILKRNMK